MLKKNKYTRIILLFFVLTQISCWSDYIGEKERIKHQIMEYYTVKYGFENEPLYQPIYAEFYNDTIYRLYWELDHSKVESYLGKFSKFESESLVLKGKNSNYVYFGIVYNRKGLILDEGFFDENLYFTGFHNWFDDEWVLREKHYKKLSQSFYEVIYKWDDNGKLIDSTYQFFPLVIPDKDSFEGPNLSICFDVQLIIDTRKYNYEDFSLFYFFYDSTRKCDTQSMVDNETIYESSFKNSIDGYYHICHDFVLRYHLMMSFGIFVPDEISEQDLTFGRMKTPIINKNLGSMEL